MVLPIGEAIERLTAHSPAFCCSVWHETCACICKKHHLSFLHTFGWCQSHLAACRLHCMQNSILYGMCKHTSIKVGYLTMHLLDSALPTHMFDLCQDPWSEAAARVRLPAPQPTSRGFSIWSVLKNAIGRDLTRITLPATINEPSSALQVSVLVLHAALCTGRCFAGGRYVSYVCWN